MLQSWLFASVPAGALDPALRSMVEQRFETGDVIFREGDATDGLYVLAAGTVRMTVKQPNGKVAAGTVSPISLIGEIGVLDGEPRTATATAIGVCVAFFIPADAFLDVLERSGLVGARLVKRFASRLRGTAGRLAELPLELPGTEPFCKGA